MTAMTDPNFEQVMKLTGRVRNARFGQLVTYLEELIDSEVWQDFTTTAGTHFAFRRCEFDYFLAAQEIDPTLVRYAYLKAEDVADLATKQFRLADITGRGAPPQNGDRRDAEEVAKLYDDPSAGGAGERIRQRTRAGARSAVVTHRTGKAAGEPRRREALERGELLRRDMRKRWSVEWTDDDKTPAEVITQKLLRDQDLACEVYKRLAAAELGERTA